MTVVLPHQSRSTRSSRATCCPLQCYFVRGDIRKEKTSFNPLPGKAEVQRRSNFEKFRVVFM